MHEDNLDFPEACDSELCERFFGMMDAQHEKWMGKRLHYCLFLYFLSLFLHADIGVDLDLLGVHPAYQGKGLASKILQWGISRADERRVEIFLSASPQGKPLYEKHGFRSVGAINPFPGYEQVSMVRPARQN